jgi:hypothetical protein
MLFPWNGTASVQQYPVIIAHRRLACWLSVRSGMLRGYWGTNSSCPSSHQLFCVQEASGRELRTHCCVQCTLCTTRIMSYTADKPLGAMTGQSPGNCMMWCPSATNRRELRKAQDKRLSTDRCRSSRNGNPRWCHVVMGLVGDACGRFGAGVPNGAFQPPPLLRKQTKSK